MANAAGIADHLEEAIKILRAYQFPEVQRADLVLEEIQKAKERLEEWRQEHDEYYQETGQRLHDTSAKHI